jgi:hypothetical protein
MELNNSLSRDKEQPISISAAYLIIEKHFSTYSKIFEPSLHIFFNRYICMYPRGDRCSTDCLSLHLCLDASNDVPHESKNVAKMTLSIQDQKNGKHVNLTTGSSLLSNYSTVYNSKKVLFETHLLTVDLTYIRCHHRSCGVRRVLGLAQLHSTQEIQGSV